MNETTVLVIIAMIDQRIQNLQEEGGYPKTIKELDNLRKDLMLFIEVGCSTSRWAMELGLSKKLEHLRKAKG